MDSYSSLQTAITSYARRQGDTAFEMALPGFVRLCESRLNRQLRLADMEKTVTLTFVDGASALPADYLEFIAVHYIDDSRLIPIYSASLDRVAGIRTTGRPCAFNIQNRTMTLYPQEDGEIVRMTYYASIPALASESTNWLLTKAPEVYLYGSLMETAPFMQDDARMAVWAALYDKAVSDLVRADKKHHHGHATSTIRSWE